MVESKNTSHILRDSLFPAITETACQVDKGYLHSVNSCFVKLKSLSSL